MVGGNLTAELVNSWIENRWVFSLLTQKPLSFQLSSFIRFPVKIADKTIRENMLKKSEKAGLGIMFTYPASIAGIRELKPAFDPTDFPIAGQLPGQLLTLPVHTYVSQKDLQKISEIVVVYRRDRKDR